MSVPGSSPYRYDAPSPYFNRFLDPRGGTFPVYYGNGAPGQGQVTRNGNAFSAFPVWYQKQQAAQQQEVVDQYFGDGLLPGDFPTTNTGNGQYANHTVQQYQGFLESWVESLPYDESTKNLLRQNLNLLAIDYLSRTATLAQSGINGNLLPDFTSYIAHLDIDGFLYNLSPEAYYQNAINGISGLSSQERNLLVQYAYQLAQTNGYHIPSKDEFLSQLEHLDPTYGFQQYLAQSGLSIDDQNRLSQLYGTLQAQAQSEHVGDFYQWLGGNPARQLLLTYDPNYALNQYIAGNQLSNSQQSALRNNYDSIYQQWQQSGQPGTFYSWLGSQNAGNLAGRVSTEQAYTDWSSAYGRTLNNQGQSNLNRAYERELQNYQNQSNRPKTFQDYLKTRKVGDVSLSQSQADLGHSIGNTRYLTF